MTIFMMTSVPMSPPWDQGDKNLAYMLARALPDHRFRVLSLQDAPEPEGENLDPVPLYRTRNPSMSEKARIFAWLLAGGERADPPDLYHMVYQPYRLSSTLNRLLPDLRRRPTLHTLPASAVEHPIRRDLFFADRVVALSEFGRARLEQAGIRGAVHIPPGIETEHWVGVGEQSEGHKAALGVEGHPVILYPGHYGPHYGAQVVLDALPTIAARVPGVRLLFACRPRSPEARQEEARARQFVAEMGLADAVHFYDIVPNMATLIGASDLVILPLATMRDKIDIPTTLLEALAAGKPIVVSDVPPMSELVGAGGEGDDGIGLVVPHDDAAALAEAVSAILTDTSLRARMARRGVELVRSRYDIHAMAQQYATLYREMGVPLSTNVKLPSG